MAIQNQGLQSAQQAILQAEYAIQHAVEDTTQLQFAQRQVVDAQNDLQQAYESASQIDQQHILQAQQKLHQIHQQIQQAQAQLF
ncbi:hypothetical protein [Bacillus alkalicellulosilyticus]|uniref:hypothetical protein n=1 Tax=Alkalihalobacterium alkalicellulosilyticum TaxID=1912214 RepID=UPI000995F2F0|nr:hypothetical protein [Bacillus alkalicellulosilyticus]